MPYAWQKPSRLINKCHFLNMTRIIVFFNVHFLIRAMFEMLILEKMDWLLSMNVINIPVVVHFNYLNFDDLLNRR